MRFAGHARFWAALEAGPRADSGPYGDQQSRDDENKAFRRMRCCAVLDEAPHNIFAIDQVGEKGSTHDQLMDQRLVTVFEIGSRHCRECCCRSRARFSHEAFEKRTQPLRR